MTPLNAELPLRTTAAWSLYREAQVIPHRYGRTGGALLQYDESRRVFVWADHPVAGIDAVLAGDQDVGGWEHVNAPDSTGRPVAFVRFAEAVEDGVALVARGRGKRHPRTGALLENPAHIVWDMLANVAGRGVTEARLGDFAAQAAALGLACGGSLDAPATVQGAVRALCASIGAVFSATASGLLRVWPGGALASAVATVDSGDVDAECALDGVITDLTLRYAFEGGEPRRALRLEAPAAVEASGRRAATLDAPWLVEPRVALAVASRLLQHVARPVWRVGAPVRGRIGVGDVVQLAHPALPVAGPALVLEHSLQPDTEAQQIGLRVAAGPAPSIRVISQSERSAELPVTGAIVETVGDQRVITLREESGQPIVGASVTLNGAITRTTDGSGRVTFPALRMPRGQHQLDVATSDGRTLTTVVVVQ